MENRRFVFQINVLHKQITSRDSPHQYHPNAYPFILISPLPAKLVFLPILNITTTDTNKISIVPRSHDYTPHTVIFMELFGIVVHYPS